MIDQKHLRGFSVPRVVPVGTGDAQKLTVVSSRLRGLPGGCLVDEYLEASDVSPPAGSVKHLHDFEEASAPWVPRGQSLDVVVVTGEQPPTSLSVVVLFDE